MDILIKYYEGCDKVKNVKLQSFTRQYKLLKMEKNEIVVIYASKIESLVHTIKSCGEVMTHKMAI